MQIDNNQRVAIVAASTVAGAGAGVAAANYMPLVNNKGEATTDRFVKEVAKEMTGEKVYNLVNAAGAQDYLDTIYPSKKGFYPSNEQIDKFFNRYGDFLEIKRENMKDEKGKPLKGKALGERLHQVVADKVAKNGEISFSKDGKNFCFSTNTTEDEAKNLIKNGFKKQKLVKAGDTISQEGLETLKSAIKTVKNERMIKGGVVAGLIALAASAIATCQKD